MAFFSCVQKELKKGSICLRSNSTDIYRYTLDFSKQVGFRSGSASDTPNTNNTNNTNHKSLEKNNKDSATINQHPFQDLFLYFNQFPLKSKKNIDYIRFHKVFVRLNDNIERPLRSKAFLRFFRLLVAEPT